MRCCLSVCSAIVWVDLDGNGKIDESDRTNLGNPFPWISSTNTTVRMPIDRFRSASSMTLRISRIPLDTAEKFRKADFVTWAIIWASVVFKIGQHIFI